MSMKQTKRLVFHRFGILDKHQFWYKKEDIDKANEKSQGFDSFDDYGDDFENEDVDEITLPTDLELDIK